MPLNELIEGVSARMTGSIVNALTGTAFEPTTLVFSIYDRATGGIINSRDETALTPATVCPSGVLAHTLAAADMAMATATATVETHVLRYKWTYNGGADVGIAELQFRVLKDQSP